MSKNLILGTGHWGQGIGALGKWGIGKKTPEVSGLRPVGDRNDSTERNKSKIVARKNSPIIAPTLQRPSAPSSFRIVPKNSFFGSQIMRKLSI